MAIDLHNRRFAIVGLPGSGKSNLARYLLRQTERHIIYDPLGEYPGYRRYVPESRRSAEELETFLSDVVIPMQPDLFIMDESNRYINPKPAHLSPFIGDLNDLSRHWGISWGVIARRPTQLHTDIFELTHFVFVYGLHGKNDIRMLNEMYDGFGKMVKGLEPFHFAVLERVPTERIYIHAPVENMDGVRFDSESTLNRGK